MDEIKKIIEELGITALETNIKIASVAVVSDSGTIIFQTENWDLTSHTNGILNIIKGDSSLVFDNVEFSVVKTTTEGIITTNNNGMGHVIIVPFQRGFLLTYAMPQADPPKALAFLKPFAMRLNGKV